MANKLLDDVIGHWSMDEGSGVTRQDDVNGLGAVDSTATPNIGGIIGNAANFFGGDRLEAPFSALYNMGAGQSFSVAFWSRPKTQSVSSSPGFAFWNANLDKRSFFVDYRGGGSPVVNTFRFLISADGTVNTQTVLEANTGQIPAAVWYHVTAVYDAVLNEMRLYVNGQATPATATHIGGAWGGNDSPIEFNSFIASNGSRLTGEQFLDEVAVWRRALDASDIALLVAATPFAQWESTPAAPNNFTAVAVGPDLIRLNWDDVPEDEDSYELQRQGPLSADVFETRYVLPPGSTTLLDGDRLVHETEYCYRIRAIVDGLPTEWSPTVCATTLEIPNPTVPVSPAVTTVQPSTWGALFHASPQPLQLALDRQDVEDRGFTILEERAFAGRTELFGYGGQEALISILEDSEFRVRVPSFFVALPVGEELTLGLIKKWADIEEVIV